MPGLGSLAPLPGVGGKGYQRPIQPPINAYPPTDQRILKADACAGLGSRALVNVAVGDGDRQLLAIAVADRKMLGDRH